MLEQLALTIAFGIIGRAVGIVTDVGVRNLISLYRGDQKNQQYINNDLKNGLNHAYLLAIMNICNECKSGLINENKESSEEFSWLEGKQRQIATDLQLVEKKDKIGDLSFSMKEIETLVVPESIPHSEYLSTIQEKLIDFTLLGDIRSPCYKNRIQSSLLNELSLYFDFEIKNNSKLRHIFESQILCNIDLHVEDLEKSIDEISKEYPELQKKLDFIQTELTETRLILDTNQKEILSVLTSNVSDLSEIKTHLMILIQQFDRKRLDIIHEQDADAIIYIKNEGNTTEKKIFLQKGKNAFLIGRRMKDTHPDIPFDSLYISKKHAMIERKNNGFFLTDKGSKNGTSINGIPLERENSYPLMHGDQIGLANNHAICYFCRPEESIETMELPR